MVSSLTRRRFLTYSGGAAIAATTAGAGWAALVSRARTDPLPVGAGVGHGHALRRQRRPEHRDPGRRPRLPRRPPELAYTADEVHPLADGLGLNPGMTGLKALWDQGRLAIVRGVSYPRLDHSHVRSMDIWQTAAPDHPLPTGWLGRWLDTTGHDPLRAVSLEPVLPPMLAGATTAGAALPLHGLTLPAGPLARAFEALGQPCAGEPPLQALAARAISNLHRTARALGPALAHTTTAPPAGGALATQLQVVARCVEMGAPTQAYSVSSGGFDTHTAERPTQQRLLTAVDQAITGFLSRMHGSARGRNVVLVAYSEFGRRVAANTNEGTDHGTAGPVFVAGAPVRGGFFGAQPSLTDLNDGDLKPTTDFRDIYATLIAGVLRTDPEPVLGPGPGILPCSPSSRGCGRGAAGAASDNVSAIWPLRRLAAHSGDVWLLVAPDSLAAHSRREPHGTGREPSTSTELKVGDSSSSEVCPS